MFTSWHKRYKGTFQNKPLLKRKLFAFPNYLDQKVWLARNASIFQDQNKHPQKTTIKAQGLLSDYLMNKRRTMQNIQYLEQNERLDQRHVGFTSSIKKCGQIQLHNKWKLKLTKEELHSQYKSQKMSILFFDRALKGNQGWKAQGESSMIHKMFKNI